MRTDAELPQIARFETARSKGNRLHGRLYADILSGKLRPGESLSEMRIAEQHGISRTPVREVFQRLAKEGLLSIVPQIGTFVAPIKPQLTAASSSGKRWNVEQCVWPRKRQRSISLPSCVAK